MKRTYIVSQYVQRAVVGVSLLLEAIPNIMLGNEVASHRVEATSEEARRDEVNKRACTKRFHQYVIESELNDNVEVMPGRELLCSDDSGSEGIEQNLERCEEDFSEDIIEAKQFETRRKVSVDTIFTHLLVVFDVVLL